MLAIGIIQESNSAWSSPTVLVKKKDGTTRFCIDYRRLNQVTKVDAYPLPHIEDSLNTLGGARFFCSLDLASGYWQVEMDAADREKTAFVTQLDRLGEAGLKLKAKKCQLFQEEILFLGHIVSAAGIGAEVPTSTRLAGPLGPA